MNLRHVIAAAAFAAVSATSFAQSAVPAPAPAPAPAEPSVQQRGTHTPLIDKHEANQEQRIKEGKQSGELTRHEARRLRAEQKAVDRAQNRAKADGTVTAHERERIRKMQNKAGKDIQRQKHDGATTTPAGK
jgi:uncharacterized membrane protein YebE (DUF533 family)